MASIHHHHHHSQPPPHQQHHRKNMKKEEILKNEARNGQNNNSRPSSASSVSSASKHSNQKTKDKGPKKEQLLQANADLSLEVEKLREDNQNLKATISAVIEKFIENAKIKGVKVSQEINNPNVSDIPVESLVALTEKLTAESHKSETMEYRLEELETRVTHLNMELAKMLKMRLDLENGLEDMVNCCESVEDFRNKTRSLIRDIQSSSLFTFLESIPQEPDNLQTGSIPQQQTQPQQQQKTANQSKERPKSSSVSVHLNNTNLDLSPPSTKLPGDTHIKSMHKDLRQYVIQQLSLPKGNGTDWRMMGDRIGIPGETIEQWKRWKLDNPMFYVLQTWSQSPGATVRLLHRHLVSPQMRCSLLAKRISDFYRVD